MRVYWALVVAAWGLGSIAQAEPLELKNVSATAKWVAHLDVDAVRTSPMAAKARETIFKRHPEAEKRLEHLRELWKFDPRSDLHGATFYGEQLKRGTGVAIVHAKVDQPLVLEKIKQAPDYQMTKHGDREIASWTHAKGTKHEKPAAGAFYKGDVLVLGASTADVKLALDVLDGAKPNLAAGESPLQGAVLPGTFCVVRAIGLAEAPLPWKSPVVKQIESLRLSIGEYQGESFVDGKLQVKKPEIAQHMKAVVEGVRAIVALAHGEDAETLQFVNGLKVSVEGNVLSVEWHAPADLTWSELQKMRERRARGGWHSPGSGK